MIESCSDLLHCESVLAQALNQVRLIGELPYTPADLEHLGGLIRAKIASGLHEGTDFLAQEAPTCLACLLVWTGIEGYQNNTYWPAVRASTGLEGSNWEARWGRIFLHFLRRRNLPTFDIEGSTAYVTPILGHGGIPNTCLPEYFEKVLAPFVERDLADPEDADAIRYELKVRREDEAECVKIAADQTMLAERVRGLQERIDQCEADLTARRDLRQLLELESQIRGMAIPPGLPADSAAFCYECESTLQNLETSQSGMENRRDECEQVAAGFGESERYVLSLAERIRQASERDAESLVHQATVLTLDVEQTALAERLHDQARTILVADWQESFGEVLTALSFAQLGQAVEHYGVLSERRAELALTLEAAEQESARERTLAEKSQSGVARFMASVWAMIRRRLPQRTEQARSEEQANRHQALRHDLDQATDELARQRLVVSSMLAELPIADRYLIAPDAHLCDTLMTLRACYEGWTQGEERRHALRLQQAQSEAELLDLSAALEVQSAANAESIIVLLEARLQTADERRLAAERALITLEREVLPRLADIAAERAVIERRLRNVQGQLSEIGGGRPEAGSARVAQALALEEAASALKADLRRRYRGLSALDLDAASNLKVAEEEALITAEADRLRVQMNQLLAEVKAYEDLCDQTPGVWSAVDEPIRRYLLYGGEAADDFLIHSVALYSSYTDRGAVLQVTDDLPSRVVVAFDDWYRQRQQEQAQRDSGREADRSRSHMIRPLVYYDPVAQEIMVKVPTHSGCHWDTGKRVELELVGTETRTQSQIIQLRLHRRPDGSTETEAREFPLPFPSERYALRLKNGDQVVCDWNWTGTGDCQHMVFGGSSGHLSLGPELPRELVHLVINAAYRVEPESCVLESLPLHGTWHQFTVQTLDPVGLDRLTLVHRLEPAQSYLIPVAPEAVPVLELLGGQLLEGITSEGQAVYAMSPDEIRLPLHSEAELRLWHLSLTRHTGRPHRTSHLRVSELEAAGAVRLRNGYAGIMLTHSMLLGSGAVGSFVLRLRRPPFWDWQSNFTVLPGLAVQFDQAVYAPYAPGKAPNVQVMINLPHSSSLTVPLPARLIQSDGLRQCVQVSTRDDFVRVAVKLGDMDLPLTVALPKTYWRLQGLADASLSLWRDQIQEEETWLDDWQGLAELFLVVALPPSVNGDLVLNLEGAMGRADRQVLRRGNARFNLLAFRDALRAGSPLRELTLALEKTQTAFPPVSLLKLRCKWEVVGMECVQESRGHKTVLTVTWQEKGKTGGHARLVRLWRAGHFADKPADQPVAEESVAKDAYQVELQVDSSRASEGEYLLQFVSQDPWAGSRPQCPEPGTVNSFPIVIVRKEDICEGCLIGITAVRLRPWNRFTPSDPLSSGLYRIRILGRIINKELPPVANADGVLVTRMNEGWYVGNVEVQPGCGLDSEAQAANPVKFEYDAAAREITAIEDRGGDGAMYCRQCRRLFWSEETLEFEKRRKHALLGPVEHFEVDWL